MRYFCLLIFILFFSCEKSEVVYPLDVVEIRNCDQFRYSDIYFNVRENRDSVFILILNGNNNSFGHKDQFTSIDLFGQGSRKTFTEIKKGAYLQDCKQRDTSTFTQEHFKIHKDTFSQFNIMLIKQKNHVSPDSASASIQKLYVLG